MRRISFIVLAALLVALARGHKPAGDAVRLEGTWVMVSGEIDTQAMPAEMVNGAKRVAKDGVTTVTINGQMFMQAKFTVDASKKPKTIDYAVTDGPTKGKK